jgi:hypothetical protein
MGFYELVSLYVCQNDVRGRHLCKEEDALSYIYQFVTMHAEILSIEALGFISHGRRLVPPHWTLSLSHYFSWFKLVR